VFEQNDTTTRAALKKNIEQKLGTVKAQSGVEDFRVVLDETNNSQNDIDLNRMNVSVIVVPTRSIEYVVIDFIVTRSGITFQ
jgi:phage tail sheath protein FI